MSNPSESPPDPARKPDRAVAIRLRWWGLVPLCVGAACLLGRSEESVKSEFNAYVEGASSCTDVKECDVAYANCPLGCFVAVRADRKADVERKGDELVAEYRRGGTHCEYDCATPTGLLCLAGRCTFGNAQPPPGTGGMGGRGVGIGAGGRGGYGGAGGRGGSAGQTQSPVASIRIDPLDGRTNTAGQPLALTITDPGQVVDAAALDALLGAVDLVKWPERTQLAFDAVVSPLAATAATQRVIQVTPRGPLEDRWYGLMLVVGHLPQTLSYQPPVPSPVTGSRFRPGSAPRVLLLEVCEGESRLNVAFSEPISGTPAAASLVTVAIGGAPVTCTSLRQDDTSVGLKCPGLGGMSQATVSLAAGLTSKTGLPVPGASFDVDVATLPSAALCRWLIAPIP